MPDFNQIILMGNLTQDPKLEHIPKGTAKVNVGFAVNRRYTIEATGEKREERMFLDLLFWAKQAETIAKHGAKGKPLHVQGRLIMDQWEDKETGQTRTRHRCQVETFQFLPSSNGGNRAEGTGAEGGGGQERRTDRAAGGGRPAADEDDGAGEGET